MLSLKNGHENGGYDKQCGSSRHMRAQRAICEKNSLQNVDSVPFCVSSARVDR